ncbi:MAG: hypothetical protein ACE5IH_07160 [Thermodesulfobacteriota bacterium]
MNQADINLRKALEIERKALKNISKFIDHYHKDIMDEYTYNKLHKIKEDEERHISLILKEIEKKGKGSLFSFLKSKGGSV